jgi:class 3 adenylate cyclase
VEQIVIGRGRPGGTGDAGGLVLLPDPVVSSRHCILVQTGDGRFLIRDTSRNGTRVSGRRLVPNVEVEIHPGDRIQVGKHEFLLETDETRRIGSCPDDDTTQLVESSTEVCILVGDIRGYTALNQRYGASEVLANVSRVFAELEAVVLEHRGTIKEYLGDAIFAYWEADCAEPGGHARLACRAALALTSRLQALAASPDAWTLSDCPLQMDWALTTGSVMLSSIGRDRPVALAMIGDAVNYAFRLEKLAGDDTGGILVCDRTEVLCRQEFRFRGLGARQVKGRARAQPVFALEGARNGPDSRE